MPLRPPSAVSRDRLVLTAINSGPRGSRVAGERVGEGGAKGAPLYFTTPPKDETGENKTNNKRRGQTRCRLLSRAPALSGEASFAGEGPSVCSPRSLKEAETLRTVCTLLRQRLPFFLLLINAHNGRTVFCHNARERRRDGGVQFLLE